MSRELGWGGGFWSSQCASPGLEPPPTPELEPGQVRDQSSWSPESAHSCCSGTGPQGTRAPLLLLGGSSGAQSPRARDAGSWPPQGARWRGAPEFLGAPKWEEILSKLGRVRQGVGRGSNAHTFTVLTSLSRFS